MTNAKHAPGYVPNPAYTQEDWDKVCDNPELTAADFARARPLAEVMPELAAKLDQVRNRVSAPDALRVDRDVLEAYQASGPGWQVRMNDVLRKAIGL